MDRTHSSSDDIDWADRSEYWQGQIQKKHPLKKFRFREPLILCGHGVNIGVDHNTLLIRNGLTHYPQTAEKFRFFPGDAELPDRIVILDGSGGITLDALSWMTDQRIEFVRLNWQGQIQSVGGNSGYSGNPKLIQAQREIKLSRGRIKLARELISEKISTSRKTLEIIFPNSEIRDKSISQLNTQARKLKLPLRNLTIAKLLGIEGASAAAYFRSWPGLPIKWKGAGKRPIPPNWAGTIPRTMGWRKRARQARHPINAMLNYGYGILASQLRTQIVAAGLDPTIGIVHERKDNPIPLVYDLMEPLRPLVDRAVLEFALSHAFTPGDFTINKWGGCRLNPQLAKRVVEWVTGIPVRSAVEHLLRQM